VVCRSGKSEKNLKFIRLCAGYEKVRKKQIPYAALSSSPFPQKKEKKRKAQIFLTIQNIAEFKKYMKVFDF